MERWQTVGVIAGSLAAILGLGNEVRKTLFPPNPAPVVVTISQPEIHSTEPVFENVSPDSAPMQQQPVARVTSQDQSVSVPAPPVFVTPSASSTPSSQAWTPEINLTVREDVTTTVCPDAQPLRIIVAKQGSGSGDGIYLKAPVQSGRIQVGEEFTLSEQCQLKLDRTGRTSSYFAEISYTGSVSK